MEDRSLERVNVTTHRETLLQNDFQGASVVARARLHCQPMGRRGWREEDHCVDRVDLQNKARLERPMGCDQEWEEKFLHWELFQEWKNGVDPRIASNIDGTSV